MSKLRLARIGLTLVILALSGSARAALAGEYRTPPGPTPAGLNLRLGDLPRGYMLADTFLLSTYRASGTLGIPYRTLEREGLTLLSWVEFTPNRMPAGFRGIAILRSELLAFQSPAGAHWFAGIFPSNYRQHTASGAGVRFARARIGDESWQATVQDTPVQAGVNHTVLLFRRGSFVVWLTVWSVRSSSVSAARSYGALLDRRVQQGF